MVEKKNTKTMVDAFNQTNVEYDRQERIAGK